MEVDFATFCYSKDANRLHSPGQLKMQVDRNDYPFDNVIVVYQKCASPNYRPLGDIGYPIQEVVINFIDDILVQFNVKLDDQYQSPTDKHHTWKPHVVNHLAAISETDADYIVFADNDCWIRHQPDSWVEKGIDLLKSNPNIFIISPNDGEPERFTQRMSQQMFLVNVRQFREMDFNQPGWDGDTNIEGGPMPEYHGMLEGRIHHYCVAENRYRYVLSPEYRYWHWNRINKDGNFEPMSAY